MTKDRQLAFWMKCRPANHPRGCWIWRTLLRRRTRAQEYVTFDGQRGHRLAWELARGSIPAGLVVDHLCLNKRCMNPCHMELVTHEENSRRAALYRFHRQIPESARDLPQKTEEWKSLVNSLISEIYHQKTDISA